MGRGLICQAILSVCLSVVMGLHTNCKAKLPTPVRGVWVASVNSESLFSDEGISQLVKNCRDLGFNTIFVVTWNRGWTLYPSDLMQRTFGVAIDPRLAGQDPLKKLIQEAHDHEVSVVAWFEFGFSSSYQQPDGGPILRRFPDWAARDKDGAIASKNGFQWMNAFHPEVQSFMLDLVMEVVNKYDVDGVQGDDRLPANPSIAGYDRWTVNEYRKTHQGQDPPSDAFDAAWVDWRADRLSTFAERLYHDVKRSKPDVAVTFAPSVFAWSKFEYLQDWPEWIRRDCVDLICPQLYRSDLTAYERELEKLKDQVPDDKRSRVVPGILVSTADGYKTTDDMIRGMIRLNRAHGYDGEVIFYHEALRQHSGVFAEVYRSTQNTNENHE